MRVTQQEPSGTIAWYQLPFNSGITPESRPNFGLALIGLTSTTAAALIVFIIAIPSSTIAQSAPNVGRLDQNTVLLQA
jgi:hypothetical protein